MQNIAIILAGGSGHRAGSNIPKQFLKIDNKTILEYCLEKFDGHPLIDDIILVVSANWLNQTNLLLSQRSFKKIKHIICGGKERYLSVLSALKIYEEQDCNLIIHDSVRPLVSQRIITEVIENLQKYQAVNVAIPTIDTIIEVDDTHTFIVGTPDRDRLYNVQTPQGFRRNILQKAYDSALQDPSFKTTDDCGVVRKYLPNEVIKIVQGESSNIKFTYPEDLLLLELLLKKKVQ